MKSFLLKNIIVRFLDGDLSPKEETELFNRKSVVSQMRQQWDSPQGVEMSIFDRERLFGQVESKIRSLYITRRRRIIAWTASVAASILLLSTIGFRLFVSQMPSDSHEVMILAYETQSMERLQLTLPDSTKVWLNAGSRIEYPQTFEPEARHVKLSGEAYFDVTHREKQPFYVQTDKIQVKVIGTQFTVNDYQNGTSAEATLISGKVNVNILSDSIERTIELFPNEQLIHDEYVKSTVIQTVDASQRSSWIHGKLYFDNAELGYIINKLEHWYGIKIDCPRELATLYRLTFTVRNESLAQVARLMQTIAPISIQHIEEHYQVITNNQ